MASARILGVPNARSAQIAVTLPRATLRIIDDECAPMGWRRSVFLAMLLVSKLGRCRFERGQEAPQYTFSADDWTTTVRYLWSLHVTLKADFVTSACDRATCDRRRGSCSP
jgi:hypothetical protein